MPGIFFARRMMFVVALQNNVFALKFGGIVLCVMLQIIFLLEVRPYKERSLYILEVMNECFLLLFFYMLPAFTPMVPNAKIVYHFGWFCIYILGPMFIVNISFVMIKAVELSIRFCVLTYKEAKRDYLHDSANLYYKQRQMTKLMENNG